MKTSIRYFPQSAPRNALFMVIAFWPVLASAAEPSAQLSRLLRRQTQQLLDAIAPGDTATWRNLTDADLIHVDEAGIVRNRTQLLSELQPLASGLVGSVTIATFKAEQHGDTVVVTHEDDERLDYHGQLLMTRFRMTDTWRRHRGLGWRLIASQVLALQQDPPAVLLTRNELCSYEGIYKLTDPITSTVMCSEEGLRIERTGRAPVVYRPELRDVFFASGEPRTRRIFVRNAMGEITGFVDRREGRDINWRKGTK